MGVILPGQSVVISVECVADKPGKHEEVRRGAHLGRPLHCYLQPATGPVCGD